MAELKTEQALNQAWTAVSVFAFVASLNIFAVVQWKMPGGLFVLPTPVFENLSRETILYLSIPFIAVLLLLSIWLATKYLLVTENSDLDWESRIPTLLNLDLKEIRKTHPSIARNWIRLGLIVLVVPLAVNLQQFHKFLVEDIPVIHRHTGREVSIFYPEWPSVLFLDSYRYGSYDGVTFWPLYSPILLIALELILLVNLARYLVNIYQFRRRKL